VVRRALAPAVALALLAVGSRASSAPPPEGVPGVQALDRRIHDARTRLEGLVELARMEQERLIVRIYRRYGPTDLAKEPKSPKDPKPREVGVYDLLEKVIANPKAPKDIRSEAVAAIGENEDAMTFDPELSKEGKGARRPRAKFSLRLAKLLTERDDPVVRELSNRLLFALNPDIVKSMDEDIMRYSAENERTWQDARKRWEKLLQKT
jgi:hypothetical protein